MFGRRPETTDRRSGGAPVIAALLLLLAAGAGVAWLHLSGQLDRLLASPPAIEVELPSMLSAAPSAESGAPESAPQVVAELEDAGAPSAEAELATAPPGDGDTDAHEAAPAVGADDRIAPPASDGAGDQAVPPPSADVATAAAPAEAGHGEQTAAGDTAAEVPPPAPAEPEHQAAPAPEPEAPASEMPGSETQAEAAAGHAPAPPAEIHAGAAPAPAGAAAPRPPAPPVEAPPPDAATGHGAVAESPPAAAPADGHAADAPAPATHGTDGAGDGAAGDAEESTQLAAANVPPGVIPAWRRFARPFPPDETRPRIAVVIAGLGLSEASTTAAIQQLPAEITLSFSPYSNRLDEWVAMARAAGHEVLIDLPMEPASFPRDDPGPQALLTSLDAQTNLARLDWTLRRAEGYVGVATYMGSRFTTDAANLAPIMAELARRGLLMLDSRAAANSLAAKLAAEAGAAHAINDRFIDNEASRVAIDGRLQQVERIARTAGVAVAMGYAYPVTIERLTAWSRGLAGKGLVLAPISAVAGQQALR